MAIGCWLFAMLVSSCKNKKALSVCTAGQSGRGLGVAFTGLGIAPQSSRVRRSLSILKGAFSTLGGVCFKTGFAGFTLEICIVEGNREMLGSFVWGNLPLIW